LALSVCVLQFPVILKSKTDAKPECPVSSTAAGFPRANIFPRDSLNSLPGFSREPPKDFPPAAGSRNGNPADHGIVSMEKIHGIDLQTGKSIGKKIHEAPAFAQLLPGKKNPGAGWHVS